MIDKLSTRQPNTLLRPGLKSGLHSRLASPTASNNVDVAALPNRIALMLDVSGSMAGQELERLRQATTEFLNSCNLSDTCLAIETFGAKRQQIALTTQYPQLLMTIMGLSAGGGTPMGDAMDYVIKSYSITRGVLVSDGCPDNEDQCVRTAHQFKEAEVPVDCVHISEGTSGERVLRQIAEITGGMFIKFSDTSNFAKNFGYLAPSRRSALALCDNNERARLLGAMEVK